jgi:hypothetical protein
LEDEFFGLAQKTKEYPIPKFVRHTTFGREIV